jgi:D-xylose transport system permease protein
MAAGTASLARFPGALVRASGIDTRLAGMLAVLVVVWLAFDLLSGGVFLTPRNLFNLSLQVAVVGIMATGMVLVIVARHIDLSVGSVLGFAGVFGAMLQTGWLPTGGPHVWWITALAMLALGTAIGAVQGALVAFAGIPAFVVTLGGLLFFRNAAWQINEGRTIAPLDPTFQLLGGGIDGTIGAFWSWTLGLLAVATVAFLMLRTRRRRQRFAMIQRPWPLELLLLGLWAALIIGFVAVMNAYERPRTGEAMGVPIPVLILIAVTILMTVLARRHRFGRHVFAMGSNPDSAALAGIDTRWLTLKVFALMGLLAGLASVVMTARLNAGASVTGTMTELNVIAAAVIGGTSLAGGVGTIYGAVLGAVIMQSLESGMVLLGVPTPLQKMILALVLILAVWIDMAYRKRQQP